MCARFTLTSSPHLIAEAFDLDLLLDIRARYNVAPTQQVLAIRQTAAGKSAAMLRWGLIPAWAHDVAIGRKLVNARSETAAEKPAFRSVWKAKRRCLIPADGFFEWKTEGKKKRPFWFHRPDRRLFAFAGLWEAWDGPDGHVETCTILTTSANRVVGALHDRMPVILNSPEEFEAWLTADDVTPLLRPLPDEALEANRVSELVNNPRHEDPRCIEAIVDNAPNSLWPTWPETGN